MMPRRRLSQVERGLWGIAVVGVVTAAALVHARPVPPHPTPPRPVSADDVAMYDRDILASAAETTIAKDAFRTERRPSRVAFGTAPLAGLSLPFPQRPHLTVGGIVGGPPWRAVLNGVPNHDGGTVVAPGDTLGGLRVRAIRRDTVIVREIVPGQDTTWTLTVEH